MSDWPHGTARCPECRETIGYGNERPCELSNRIAALEAERTHWDKALRGSVPEDMRDATSPVGCVQNYIVKLERENARLREAIQDFPSLIGDKSHEIPWEFYLAAYNRLKDAAKEDSDE